jgi:hypothetical protein
VTITEDPIESGHGVHGEQVHASFRGLPEGLRLTGSGRIDMRGGGHLELEVDAEDPQLARAIKAAVLAALP